MHTLDSPLFIPRGKKNWNINLNIYKISHYRTQNSMKIKYKEIMEDQILRLPKLNRITLVLTLYPKTKRLCDVSNICSITDKFFCDALVELGRLPEDNYLFIPEITYRFGAIDKDNPRVCIAIHPI